jgi:hypothetical protein
MLTIAVLILRSMPPHLTLIVNILAGWMNCKLLKIKRKSSELDGWGTCLTSIKRGPPDEQGHLRNLLNQENNVGSRSRPVGLRDIPIFSFHTNGCGSPEPRTNRLPIPRFSNIHDP